MALAAGALAAAALCTRQVTSRIEQRNPPVGRFVETSAGTRLHYVEAGEGSPVVLLHGATNLLQDMTSSLLPRLARSHRVVAFDRPGHGYSERQAYRAWDEAQARAIHDGVRRLGLHKPVIVGHSISGGIAMAYGMLFPDELAGIVFLAGLAFPETPSGAWKSIGPATPGLGSVLSYTLYQPLQRLMVPSMLKKFFAPQEMPERYRQEMPVEMLYRPQAIKANAEDQLMVVASLIDLALHYSRYPLPVVVMAGTEDQTTDPLRHAVPLAARLPRARLHMLPGLGHMIHHFAQDEIAQAVEEIARST